MPGGNLGDAVFWQGCDRSLHHVMAGFKGSCKLTTPVLVLPSVLKGWAARFKGTFTCAAQPVNRTGSLTVIDFGQNSKKDPRSPLSPQ